MGKKVTQLLRLCPLPYHHDEQNHNSNYCHHCHCFCIFMCGTYIWGNYHHHLAKEVTKSQVLEHPPKPENFSRALQRRRRLFWRGWSWMWKSAWSVDVWVGSITINIVISYWSMQLSILITKYYNCSCRLDYNYINVLLIVAVANLDYKILQLQLLIWLKLYQCLTDRCSCQTSVSRSHMLRSPQFPVISIVGNVISDIVS